MKRHNLSDDDLQLLGEVLTEAYENGKQFIRLFDEIWRDSNRLQDVTDIVVENISIAYRETKICIKASIWMQKMRRISL